MRASLRGLAEYPSGCPSGRTDEMSNFKNLTGEELILRSMGAKDTNSLPAKTMIGIVEDAIMH